MSNDANLTPGRNDAAGASRAAGPQTRAAALSDRDRDEQKLHRGLTSAQISMIGLSGALGTGLFLGSGSMIGTAGPGVILSYAITGIFSLIVVWCLAEMTVVHPVAGGFGASAHAYLGPIGGWLVRWNLALVLCIAVGAEVVAAGKYLNWYWPSLSVGVGTVLCSLLIVTINLAAVRFYGASEYWFSIIKVTMVVLFLLLGFVLIFFGLPGHHAIGLGNLTQGKGWQGFAPMGWAGILTGAVIGLFSFGGSESVSVAAAESENPERDVPRAARAMILRLVLFYVGAVAVIVALQPWQKTASGKGDVVESPFVTVLSLVNVPAAAGIMNFILITAALSAANGCLYGSARMIHSLATDGLAPRALAVTSSSGAPRRAVFLATLGMVTASVMAMVSPDKAFMTLFGILIFGTVTSWLLICLSYIAFRLRRKKLGLPAASARMWLGIPGAVAVILALLAAYVELGRLAPFKIALTTGIPYLLILLVAGFLVSRRHRSVSVLDEELLERQGRGELADTPEVREALAGARDRHAHAHGHVAGVDEVLPL